MKKSMIYDMKFLKNHEFRGTKNSPKTCSYVNSDMNSIIFQEFIYKFKNLYMNKFRVPTRFRTINISI